MADEHNQTTGAPGDHDSTGWIILGALLIIIGFFLGGRSLGIVPWPLGELWDWGIKARGGIGVILLGILLIVWAQSGKRIAAPPRGRKLYRSRGDKWLTGVLGGLAGYLGIESTVLRLAFLALVVFFDVGGLIVAYIVMAIVVPEEPKTVVTSTPAAPAPVAPAETFAAPPVAPVQLPVAPAAPVDEVNPPA